MLVHSGVLFIAVLFCQCINSSVEFLSPSLGFINQTDKTSKISLVLPIKSIVISH
ncbi:hypothetical protein THOG11_60210 [Vibrio harveyi]|nr:hypothetical protein TH15OA1_430080 [Vibrio harveyi]CAH1544427.1 hypothetical protein VHARVF571_580083 [Vibrio harveyi]CAH1574912.1 hypothetical protein THOD03_50210 [Vibrio harveyi]CAH1584209.1 hypothetical protein THOG11_60210 [Vibrio harveyi]